MVMASERGNAVYGKLGTGLAPMLGSWGGRGMGGRKAWLGAARPPWQRPQGQWVAGWLREVCGQGAHGDTDPVGNPN